MKKELKLNVTDKINETKFDELIFNGEYKGFSAQEALAFTSQIIYKQLRYKKVTIALPYTDLKNVFMKKVTYIRDFLIAEEIIYHEEGNYSIGDDYTCDNYNIIKYDFKAPFQERYFKTFINKEIIDEPTEKEMNKLYVTQKDYLVLAEETTKQLNEMRNIIEKLQKEVEQLKSTPIKEEPKVEEPTPTKEEPTVEEPKVEEPKVEEPTVEEPTPTKEHFKLRDIANNFEKLLDRLYEVDDKDKDDIIIIIFNQHLIPRIEDELYGVEAEDKLIVINRIKDVYQKHFHLNQKFEVNQFIPYAIRRMVSQALSEISVKENK